jgi:hypothetical protein
MYSTSPNPKRSQGGYAALALVLVIAVTLAALIAAYSARRGYVGVSQTHRAQREFLARAQRRITRYYSANAAAMDANLNAPWTGAQLLANAGVPSRWLVEAFVGARQSLPIDGGMATLDYRDVWLALPGNATGGPATTATLDRTTNTFNPGTSPAWTEIHGETIEAALTVRAQKQLNRWGSRLTAMYAADTASDPGRNIGVDYWQPEGCGPYGGGIITCTNGQFLSASNMGLSTALGAQRISANNPWGLSLQISNTVDANDTAPPYTLAIKSPLPWGGAIYATVTEPLT